MAKSKNNGSSKGEKQVQKSPAEFFAENQSIAGFDNLGKSLYTSIRELVENSLDACESIMELPNISIDITEYTQRQFNQLHGIGDSPRKTQKDTELFQKSKKGAANKKKKKGTDDDADGNDEKAGGGDSAETGKKGNNKKQQSTKQNKDAYFLLTVRDNGCGMRHDDIPNLLGRVLSGSKYGVRQTRGKFGLGAKMALIWSKKSSGQPIQIKTSHRATSTSPIPSHISTCVLDIDIYKNTPRIIEHTKVANNENWIGSEVSVIISGNWTTYKSRIVQYFQQLAVITPYACLELRYANLSDSKKNMSIQYGRRSEQMPAIAKQVKHHPSSVNNLVIQQLIQFTRTRTLVKFLSTELSCVSPAIATRLIKELGSTFNESMNPKTDLSSKQITRLVQLLKQVQLFKAPDGSCLSPLGEYNLNLGIQKVLEPEYIATARDKVGHYEGHPFVVEAAVSLGGSNTKEGITVTRFANRIPLLFEGGADVATRVALTKIRWSNYKIDYKRDKVGVFVSIVSTKIPFKGTSKEYIGDDATSIQLSVKRALQSCCQQLRARLTKRNALKDAKERKSRLTKHVPDIGRSLFGILDAMRKRKIDTDNSSGGGSRTGGGGGGDTSPSGSNNNKRRKLNSLDTTDARRRKMIRMIDNGQITEQTIRTDLEQAIDDQLEMDDLIQEHSGDTGGSNNNKGNGKKKIIMANSSRKSGGGGAVAGASSDAAAVPVPVFLVPLYNLDESENDICTSTFTFRPIQPISIATTTTAANF